MLNAIIYHGGNTMHLTLPMSAMSISENLNAIGILKSSTEVSLTDEEGEDIRVKLYAETDLGNHLLRIFKENNQLSDVNITCMYLKNLSVDHQQEVNAKILKDEFDTTGDLMDELKKQYSGKIQTITLYCPLSVQKQEEYGWDINPRIIHGYENDIRKAISKDLKPDDDVAFYFDGDESVRRKLVSVKWDVRNLDNELHGAIDVKLNDHLTDKEFKSLAKWIYDQNYGGFGSEFRSLETEEGSFYFSFWKCSDYFLLTRDEYDQRMNPRLSGINTAEPEEIYNPAIVFSRVKLWTDTGEECEFFMGGVPKSYDDIDQNEDFEDFVKQLSTGDTQEITAYITTFSEGQGEPQPASQADIDRIYNAIADVDIDTITGWTWIGENSFTFDYDIDELFHMNGIE